MRLLMCHLDPFLRACVCVLFALAFLLRLFASPYCVVVAAFVFLFLRLQWGNPDSPALRVDSDEREIRRRNMTIAAIDCMFHPHLDPDFHGSTERTIEAGL